MPGLLPNVDPDGLLEYSVVYTDRALNHMSQSFQGVMKDISATLKKVYNARAVAVVPGSGTFAMEAVARQFATGRKCLYLDISTTYRLEGMDDAQRQCLTDMAIHLEKVWPAWRDEYGAGEAKKQADAGIKVIDLGPGFRQRAHDLYWEALGKASPENVAKLKKMLTK